MCGFAGELVVGGAPDGTLVRTMSEQIRRRGPDDDGHFARGPVALAFRRLAILDLSPAGHQPFLSQDRNLAIVFNGEIFNYLELRAELVGLGHSFHSESDTEVLLASYEQWGTDCLRRFNGMWAFLIADYREGVLFGARDRFGVKPMYRSRQGDTFRFGSEIKTLRAANPRLSEINWDIAGRFLADCRLDGMTTDGATFFRDIEELKAGHAFTITFGGVERTWAYWTLPTENDVLGEQDFATQVRDLVEDSVRLRLRSDVPVGVALSGGMDSSSIIALMARIAKREGSNAPVHAFSYMPEEFNEETYIKASIELTGATLHRTARTPAELWNTLDEVLQVHDEPLHSPTALVGYQVYALAAANGVRVVLGGQGADEALGGYQSYYADAWNDGFASGHAFQTMRDIADFCDGHGAPYPATVMSAIRRFGVSRFSSMRGDRPLEGRYSHWLAGAASNAVGGKLRERPTHSLHSELQRSLEQHPLPLFLRIEDRNSMGHSIEARLPFMDYRLVTLAFQMPNSWKLRGRWNKYALREGMRGIIPEVIRTRVDKMGFPTGFSAWIRGPLEGAVRAQIEDPSFARLGVFDVKAVRAAFDAHVAGREDHALAIFHALQFQRWTETIVRQDAPTAVAA